MLCIIYFFQLSHHWFSHELNKTHHIILFCCGILPPAGDNVLLQLYYVEKPVI